MFTENPYARHYNQDEIDDDDKDFYKYPVHPRRPACIETNEQHRAWTPPIVIYSRDKALFDLSHVE